MSATKIRTAIALAAAAAGLAATSAPAHVVPRLQALTTDGALVTFDADRPSEGRRTTIRGPLDAFGVQGFQLEGIDREEGTDRLWALGPSASTVYRLDPRTGAPLAAMRYAGATGPSFDDLAYGFEVGRFFGTPATPRIASSSTSGLGMGDVGAPTTGGLFPTPYAPGDPAGSATPAVSGLAVRPATASSGPQPYGIDDARNTLTLYDEDLGAWRTIGSLGVDVPSAHGFDVVVEGGRASAFLAFQEAPTAQRPLADSALYRVDLATGTATRVGAIRTVVLGLLGARTAVHGLTSLAPQPSSTTPLS